MLTREEYYAQLFIGKSGYGVLPVALAISQYILCRNTGGENNGGEDRCNIQCNQFNHPDLHFVFLLLNQTNKTSSI